MENQLMKENGCSWKEAHDAVMDARYQLGLSGNDSNERALLLDAARALLPTKEETMTAVAYPHQSDVEANVEAPISKKGTITTTIPCNDVVAYTEAPPAAATTTATTSTIVREAPAARKAAKCCGCCCDFRRAVIAVAILLAALEALVLIYVVSGAYMDFTCGDVCYYSYSYYSTYNEDYCNECQEHFGNIANIEMIFSIVSIILGIGAVVGAVRFNAILVGLNATWIVLGACLGIFIASQVCKEWEELGSEYYCINFSSGIGAVIIAIATIGLFVYPHVGFIIEVQKGILTKETYQNEKYSCCCISDTATSVTATATVAPNPPPPTPVHDVSSAAQNPISTTTRTTHLPNGYIKKEAETINSDGSKSITTTFESF